MLATMFGFRKHLGTQDVMAQLHELVIKQATRASPRAILALDLKGAFDNVTHANILRNLTGTGCGARAFLYVRNFLEDRAAILTIGDAEMKPITLGEQGTPQGSVISPLLFNLALLGTPTQTAESDRRPRPRSLCRRHHDLDKQGQIGGVDGRNFTESSNDGLRIHYIMWPELRP